VWTPPPGASEILPWQRACGRVLTCVRPRDAAAHAAGPYGSARIGARTVTRARSALR
jgi:hypothetical protein